MYIEPKKWGTKWRKKRTAKEVVGNMKLQHRDFEEFSKAMRNHEPMKLG